MIDITSFGAVGDDSTDNTSALTTAIAAAVSAKDELFIPPGIYQTGPLTLTSAIPIRGVGMQSELKLKLLDLSVVGDHALIKFDGTSSALYGVVVSDLLLNGNKSAHSNLGSRTSSMDVLNLVNCRNSTVDNVHTKNSLTDGIDLDDCERCVIHSTINYNNDGYGIHVSGVENVGSHSNIITDNHCFDNGFERSRGGIDQNEFSSNNLYANNYCKDNYRNFRIVGSGGLFEGNRSLNGSVGDVWSGALIERNTVRYKNFSNSNATYGDVIAMPVQGHFLGNGSADQTVSITYPTSVDVVIGVQVTMLGRNTGGAPSSVYDVNLTMGHRTTTQPHNFSNSGCDIRFLASGAFGGGSYYSFMAVVWARKKQ